MLDQTLRPPTDNLYKFLALAGLVLAALLLTLLFRELFRLQRAHDDAVVTLVAAGMPADAAVEDAPDDGARSLILRRDLLRGRAVELQRLFTGAFMARLVGGSLAVSTVAFGLWYLLVQRPQDELLRRQVAAAGPDPVPRRAGLLRLLHRRWRRRQVTRRRR